MKKLTAFLILFFCVTFAQISAQQHTIRWSVGHNAQIEIRVNGTPVVNWSTATNGTFVANEGDLIEVEAGSTDHGVLSIVMTEEDEAMIEHQRNYPPDWNWLNIEQTHVYEQFALNVFDMYIEIM